VSRTRIALSVCSLLVLLCVEAVAAASIAVKGTTLTGKIVDIEAGKVLFETIYGSGTLEVPFADIEAIESEGRFHVLHGDDEVAVGRIVGVGEGVLLVGENASDATRVAFDTIVSAQNEAEAGQLGANMRRSLRYWTGNVAFGFDAKQATTDTTTLTSGWLFERRKAPWRFLLSGRYFFDTEKQKGEDSNTLDNELKGRLRGEYDLFERAFTYAGWGGEYDEVEDLSIRSVPTGGFGYRFAAPAGSTSASSAVTTTTSGRRPSVQRCATPYLSERPSARAPIISRPSTPGPTTT
jgi:hypothetical protein